MRSDITNLSLQDEETLSYVTYFEALETRLTRVGCFKNITSTYRSACSSFETRDEDPSSLIYAPQKRNFKFQATGSPHLAGVFPIFRKYGTDEKVCAIDSSHRTRPEQAEQVDAQRRAYKSGTFLNHKRSDGTIWSNQPKRTPLFEMLQTRIGKQYTYMLEAYDMRSITVVGEKETSQSSTN